MCQSIFEVSLIRGSERRKSDKDVFSHPLLCNVCSEEMFRKALEDISDDTAVNGQCSNKLPYAYDPVILAVSDET